MVEDDKHRSQARDCCIISDSGALCRMQVKLQGGVTLQRRDVSDRLTDIPTIGLWHMGLKAIARLELRQEIQLSMRDRASAAQYIGG